MAKISNLPALATADVDGTELMPVVKNGTTHRVSGADYFEKIAEPYVDALKDVRDAPIPQLMLDSSSTADALIAPLPSGMTAYLNGQQVYFIAAAANTGAVTLDIGGLGSLSLRDERGGLLVAGDLIAGVAYFLRISTAGQAKIIASHYSPKYLNASPAFTGTPTAPTANPSNNSNQVATTAFVQEQLTRSLRTLSGIAGQDDMVASMPMGMSAYTSGQVFLFQKSGGTNSGAVTLNIGDLGALPVNDNTGAALQEGDLESGGWYVVRNISGTSFRVIVPYPLPRQVIASAVTASGAATATARAQARIDYSWSPNLIADPYLETAGATVAAPAWSAAANVVTKSGMKCVELPAAGAPAVSRRWLTFLDVSAIPAGTPMSLACVIAEKLGTSDTGHRIRVYGYNSAGASVAGIWNLPGNDLVGDTAAYTRNMPAASISTPSQVVIWEGVPLPAGLTMLALDFRLQNSPATYVSGFVARIGSDPAQTSRPGEIQGSGGVIYLDPTGSDANAGAAAAPLATLQAAINKLGGSGTIYMGAGDYAAMSVNPASVTGKVRIIGKRGASPGYDAYPRIFLSAKLTGITRTDGFTKVYQAAVAGLPALANFNWAYQDGVADPRSAIADAERFPQHRGRAHRLADMCKLVKTTATTLADALAEIDAADADDPRAFIDAGILYFSIVGGGDATAASIYVDASAGLFSAATRETAGEIEIRGIELRYGGMNLTPFRAAHLDEVRVLGARENAIDYSVLTFGTLETACAGSATGTLGDGLNGHYGAKLWGMDLYTHDNQDDGFSDHEGCSSRLFGGLAERNGGTALAPAAGGDHVACNFVSQRNQLIPGRKAAAFNVIGVPADSPIPDQGYDTSARWINCTSIGDSTGFRDGGTATSRAVCEGCKVFDMAAGTTGYGFRVGQIIDCGFASGAGTAKHSTTIVRNTTLIT